MKIRSTTILTVRHQDVVAIGGDGQVSLGDTVIKADAVKIRRLLDGQVITGVAGGTADAFALLERFEAKLKDHPANMPRAATELAKEWRTDRALRRLEAARERRRTGAAADEPERARVAAQRSRLVRGGPAEGARGGPAEEGYPGHGASY